MIGPTSRRPWLALCIVGLALLPAPRPSAQEPAATAVPDSTFTIRALEPDAEGGKLVLTFTDRVEWNALRRNLRLVPPVELHWHASDLQGERLALPGEFQAGRYYIVTLPQGLKSENGRDYDETLVTFTMPDRRPGVVFADEGTLLERDSRQMLYATLVNVDQVLFEGVRVPPILLPLLHPAGKSQESRSIRDIEGECRGRYRALADALAEDPVFGPFLGSLGAESHLFFSGLARNEEQRFSMPLTFRQQPARGVIEFVRLSDNRDPAARHTPTRLLRITDLGTSYKRSKDGLLVWVTSLRTGLPVRRAAVMVFDGQRNAYVLGRTEADGCLAAREGAPVARAALGHAADGVSVGQAPLPVGELVGLVVRTDDDVTWMELVPEGNLPSAVPDVTVLRTKAHLFTERGVYRPGETVHFKGTLRSYSDDGIASPTQESAWVAIRNAKGEEVYRRILECSDFGTVSDSLDLPAYAPLGRYAISAGENGGSRALATHSFQVEEFRPPRHRTEVTIRRETQDSADYVNLKRTDDRLNCRLSGRYYAGGPVKHGQVRWDIYSAETDYPQEAFPGFRFGCRGETGPEFLETGESILDETGELVVTVPMGPDARIGRHGVRVVATVIDFDGRAAAGSATHQVKPDFLVGIGSHPDSVKSGEPLALRMVVLDPKRRALQQGSVEVRVLEYGYYYYQRRNGDGDAYWRWDAMWRRQQEQQVPIVRGEAEWTVLFPSGGQYLLECRYRAPDGREFVSTSPIEVDWTPYWRQDPEDPRNVETLRLLPDRDRYAVGDTMRIALRTPRPLAACLVTVERDGVLEYRLARVEDGRLELPVREAYRPNVYVSVLGTIPRGTFPSYTGEYDDEAPGFVFGTVNVAVARERRALSVAIGPEGGPLRARPGEELSLDLRVTDEKGQGVLAEVAVGVVDEQVLALSNYQTPRLDDLLTYVLPLGVRTGESRKALQPQTPFRPFRSLPLSGGDGADSDWLNREPLSIDVRKNFNPVAFFDPAVRTDANGEARVEFRFPDTMTTYRIYAVACDRGERFASVEREALVIKEFYLEPGLPAFLNHGDRARFHVAAFNKTDQESPVELGVETEPALDLRAVAESASVGPFDRALVPFEARADTLGPVQLTFSGRAGAGADVVQTQLPVHSGFLVDRDVFFGTFKGRLALQHPIPAERIPWEMVGEEDLSVELMLSGSPFARVRPGLRYLLEYPYGCIEQTSSRVLPLAALRGLIVDGLVPGITVAETDAYLTQGIDRILSMQTGSGGFGYWPGHGQPSAWGSLYGITALVYAREAGIDLPGQAMKNAFDYLAREMSRDEPDAWDVPTFRALAAFVLARADRLQPSQFDEVMKTFAAQGRQGKLYLLLAAKARGFLPEERLAAELQRVLPESAGSDRVDAFHARGREPAAALLASCAILPSSTWTDGLVRDLMDKVGGNGAWTSSSDTGWALVALRDYLKGQAFAEGSTRGAVRLGGREVATFVLDPTQTFTLDLDPRDYARDPNLEVVLDQDHSLTYELALLFPRVDYAESGLRQGFRVEKSIVNTAGDGPIRIGDVVKVELRIEVDESEARFLVIDDPLPAGLVAINTALATEQPVRESDADRGRQHWNYWDPSGYYRLVPEHFEIHDDRVLVFRDYIWRGSYLYTYYARAVCEGEFRIPSTKVQLMYRPDVRGYTPESQLVVAQR